MMVSSLTIEPCNNNFGAVLRGIQLHKDSSDAVTESIRKALGSYGFLIIPEQSLSPEGLEVFAARMGEFGVEPYLGSMDGYRHIVEVRREASETTPIFGSQWHSDWSFQDIPPAATMLYGVEVPPIGGDTVFADSMRAFEHLSPKMTKLLSDLQGVHTAAPSYGLKGLFAKDDSSRSMKIKVSAEAEKTQRHPIVRKHPDTGRCSLYINHVYTTAIEGLDPHESKELLAFLFRHMTQAAFRFRHRWEPKTLLIWDNRSVIHYADGGYEGYRRLMYRATLKGERPLANVALR
jgi:taurine dioxygenase